MTKLRTKLVMNAMAAVSGNNISNRLFTTVNSGNNDDVVIREEMLENRAHWVVPMVMAVEGVLNGSLGPLYYPNDELSKNVPAWNHKPIIVYHPKVDKSACDPQVMNEQKIGVILNTKYEDNKLKAEAWIEKERVESVDARVAEAITNKKAMELSTGLQVDVEPTKGVWNSKDYVGVARNYVPDHLAILPDEIGASSLADGAGFVRNSKGKNITDDVTRMLQAYGLTLNELSHSQIRRSLDESLTDLLRGLSSDDLKAYGFEKRSDSMYFDFWVVEVYDDYFIYEVFNDYYKLNYSNQNDTITISGEPQEVERKISYEAKVSNNNNNKDNTMDRKEQVDAMIQNGSYQEADREWLMELKDETFTRVHNNATKAAENAEPSGGSRGTGDDVNGKEKEVEKVTNKAPSVEEYIDSAPSEIQAVLNEGRSALKRQKDELITKITANKRNVFDKGVLETKGLDELRGIAALAENQEDDQGGQQRQSASQIAEGASAHNGQVVENEGLAIPSTTAAEA